MCAHPQSAHRVRVAFKNGYTCELKWCNACKAEYQRMRRAIKRAFWLLATARWA